MSNQITIAANFDCMTIEKNGRSIDLSIEQASDLYYRIGETFYGVNDPSDDWGFPILRIAGEKMAPTEVDMLLHCFSEAREKVDWRNEGF